MLLSYFRCSAHSPASPSACESGAWILVQALENSLSLEVSLLTCGLWQDSTLAEIANLKLCEELTQV